MQMIAFWWEVLQTETAIVSYYIGNISNLKHLVLFFSLVYFSILQSVLVCWCLGILVSIWQLLYVALVIFVVYRAQEVHVTMFAFSSSFLLVSREKSLDFLKYSMSLEYPRRKGQIEITHLLFSHYAGRIKGGWIYFPYFLLLGLNPLSLLSFHFLSYKDLNTHNQHWSGQRMDSENDWLPLCVWGNSGSVDYLREQRGFYFSSVEI